MTPEQLIAELQAATNDGKAKAIDWNKMLETLQALAAKAPEIIAFVATIIGLFKQPAPPVSPGS